MKKIVILVLLQLVISINNVYLSETSDRDNTTKLKLTTIGSVLNVSESTTLPENVTSSETTTLPTTTSPLIPVATVEAQIKDAEVVTKKPSRIPSLAA